MELACFPGRLQHIEWILFENLSKKRPIIFSTFTSWFSVIIILVFLRGQKFWIYWIIDIVISRHLNAIWTHIHSFLKSLDHTGWHQYRYIVPKPPPMDIILIFTTISLFWDFIKLKTRSSLFSRLDIELFAFDCQIGLLLLGWWFSKHFFFFIP